MKTIRDIQISEKRVFIRVDFNVPLDEHLQITDDTRIREALPTIRYALEKDAKLIIASHLGRPKGEKIPEFSLAPVARGLEAHLNRKVQMADDCIGPGVEALTANMKSKDVVLLENLRFYPEEEKNDPEFAKRLSNLCDVYVNDAFAVSHRNNASVAAITQYAPIAVGGLLLEKEITYFNKSMENPQRPLVAVVGGAKVSSKLGALKNMLLKVDKMIIGGAMANTFLKSKGIDVGQSKIESDLLTTAKTIIEDADKKGVELYLPVDVIAADRFDAEADSKVVLIEQIPQGWMALDIGPSTVNLFRKALQDAKTIVWNGPMGAFEMPPFAYGTMSMANTLAESNALTIVGGGDTDVAVHHAKKADQISYISTGGGAFLTLLEGKPLPALVALLQASQ